MAGLYPAGTMFPCEGCGKDIWPESRPLCESCQASPTAPVAEVPVEEPIAKPVEAPSRRRGRR